MQILLAVFLTGCPLSSAQKPPVYLYHGYGYGSEAVFHPLSVLVNGGYSIFQLASEGKRIDGVDYRNGWRNVWRNILHPVREIGEFGWGKFIGTEIFPSSLKRENGQWAPNYEAHVLGGGIAFRSLCEWYAANGFSHAGLWAAVNTMAYHLWNETVENNRYIGTNVDPIADIWIFDPLGMLLFSSDRVARFFGETLHARDWSTFPAVNPFEKTIENNSDSFSMKWFFPGQDRWSLFYNFGLNSILGLSYTWPDGSCLSAGGGVLAKNRRKVDPDEPGYRLTVDFSWNAGVFYDRNGSLMASLLLSGSPAYKARLNVFPGLVRIGRISPGFFAILTGEDRLVIGATVLPFPVGLAFQK